MTSKHLLTALFASIALSLAGVTIWASLQQPVWEWQGLIREPDRGWTIATLLDAYYGFITFCVWVCWKERSVAARVGWLVAIMALGNMAMASYVLLQLFRLRPGEPAHAILASRRTA